jgi:glycosyltransferase involved in cell wall biosynthesis
MVDLATLRGLVPNLARMPCIYYCHENQFAYPESPRQSRPLEPLMVNLYGALAADSLVFNSQWNLRSFLVGVEGLLKSMPDEIPPGILAQLAAKACVLPVPLLPAQHSAKTLPPFDQHNPLHVVWNHRWEFDKGPDLLLALIEALPAGLPLRWHVVGQQFRQQPPQFAAIKKLLEGQLASWGFCADEQTYQAILAQSHVVLSTAWHDFQGLAVLEAASLGAVPLVPNGLAYLEWFGEHYSYGNSQAFAQRDVKALAASAAERLTAYANGVLPLKPVYTQQWQWPQLKASYIALLSEVVRDFNCRT